MCMYKVLHFVYDILGHMLAFFANIYFSIRDRIKPPNETSILFVAHPDDDALFFHNYITLNKPYVVLLTTGGIINRFLPFCRAMREYGVRYRAFDMKSRAVDREDSICKNIKTCLHNGCFSVCATHNEEGEYGHIMHQCIHRCVKRVWQGDELLVPCNKQLIMEHKLSDYEIDCKRLFLQTFYSREYPTLQTFETWITHECLITINCKKDEMPIHDRFLVKKNGEFLAD